MRVCDFFSLQAHERDSLRELPPTRHPPSRRNYKKIDDERGATFFSRRELLSNATAGNYWLHRARAFRRKKRIQDFINPDRVKSVRGRERERSARLAAQLSTQPANVGQPHSLQQKVAKEKPSRSSYLHGTPPWSSLAKVVQEATTSRSEKPIAIIYIRK